MKLNLRRTLLACATSLPLLVGLLSCGGASLDYGQPRDLSAAKANYVDPAWYEDYTDDPLTAARKYKNKVIEVDLRVEDFVEVSGMTGVRGTTGESDAYRITCLFPQSASNRVQSLDTGDRITVKGLFDGIDDMSATYEIQLVHCVLVWK